MQQDTLSYDSICMLIGRLTLQHHLQIEQLGKSLADIHAENAKLRQDIINLKQNHNDGSGKGIGNQ